MFSFFFGSRTDVRERDDDHVVSFEREHTSSVGRVLVRKWLGASVTGKCVERIHYAISQWAAHSEPLQGTS